MFRESSCLSWGAASITTLPGENPLGFCSLSEVTNDPSQGRWDGSRQGSFAEWSVMGAMWDGERVKQEGVEMGHGLGGVSCSPPIRAVPAELGVMAQGAVMWGGRGG